MTIIAATDYSEIAENAVEYAAAVAKFVKAKLVLLNDLTLTVSTSNSQLPAHRIQELIDENATRLAEKASSLSARYGIEVSPKATFSFVANELKLLLSEHEDNLVVVMGMAEKTIEQDLWGNTTTSVIKKLHSPVLAVPAGARFEGIKKVLFACDLLHGVSAQLLERIKTIAVDNQAEVEVLLVNETVEELKQKGESRDALKDIDEGLEGIVYYYKNIKSDSVIEAIKNEVEKSGANLLIMAPQKHGFWDAVIHQSKTRKMAAGLDIPLLSIPVS
ncbi:MAG: universal stress protein [Bacteroidetes bacterium]|nr:universal stress protein [Bacteroidota bacterium]